MKCLIILTLAVAAHAQFLPLDSPDVAAAKAQHFRDYAQAAALVGAPLQEVYRTAPIFANQFTLPTVNAQGFLEDTPEVASAKAAHFAEVARAQASAASAATHFNSDPNAEYYRSYYENYYRTHAQQAQQAQGYTGPQAMLTLLPSGYLQDTPEVANARYTHLYKHYQESTRQ